MRRTLWFICLIISISVTAPAGAAAQGTLYLEGYVFRDDNLDGVRQPGEPGIGGVTVQLTPDATAVSDLLGYYRFEGLEPGDYQVEAQPPSGYLCVLCQVTVNLDNDPHPPVNLALRLVAAYTATPTPTATPTDSPTPSATATPTPTRTRPPTDTPAPTFTPAPSATPGKPVITFYVDPARSHYPGDCATLHWWVANATEVFLLLPSGQIGVEGSGQRQVCPATTTTYQLKVNGQDGSQEIVAATLIVPPPPTSTPRPPARPKPTRKPSVTPTATPTNTPASTLTPTPTPLPAWTPLPEAGPEVDPLLAGLPLRWGSLTWSVPGDTETKE